MRLLRSGASCRLQVVHKQQAMANKASSSSSCTPHSPPTLAQPSLSISHQVAALIDHHTLLATPVLCPEPASHAAMAYCYKLAVHQSDCSDTIKPCLFWQLWR